MEWHEIKGKQNAPEEDQFAVIGKGRIKLSRGACKLIGDFDQRKYVTFLKAKKDRIYFLGLRFEEKRTENSVRIDKPRNGYFGASIIAGDLVFALYGEEGSSDKYTKHAIAYDSNMPNVIVVYYNYRNKYVTNVSGREHVIRTRHIGSVVDGEWKVISSSHKNEERSYPVYLLRNIHSGEEIIISTRALIDIERGITTVAKIKMSRNMSTGSYLGKMRAAKKKKLKLINESA